MGSDRQIRPEDLKNIHSIVIAGLDVLISDLETFENILVEKAVKYVKQSNK